MENNYFRLIVFLQFTFMSMAIAADPANFYDIDKFVNIGLEREPRLNEKQFAIDNANLTLASVRNSAILPKFEITTAIGPAPEYSIKQNSSGEFVQNYDFTELGPFAGVEVKVLQPLSISKLKNGLKAAKYNCDVNEYDYKKSKIETSQNLQEIYFKYLYAKQMMEIARDVKSRLQKTIASIEQSLDDDNPSGSQNDLLELRTYMFKADDGLYQAQNGMETARLAMGFCINEDNFVLKDSLIYLREERIPDIDTLKSILIENHPDLKKLASGIMAQKKIVDMARRDLYPDAFIIGSFKLSKAWNENEGSINNNENLLNPFNKKEGSLGLGLRFNVNVWSVKDKYDKEKLSLESLEFKNNYARKGLIVEIESQYNKVILYKKRIESAEHSLSAADSWLKGIAMKYDIDPSQAAQLLKTYEKNIQAKKDYYECILDYDIAVAGLLAKTGLTLSEFKVNFNK